MSLKLIPPAVQLEHVSQAIQALVGAGVSRTDPMLDTLKLLSADLRGRLAKAPTEAVEHIERRIAAVHRAGDADFELGPLVGVAQEVMGRWQTIRQALEFYDSHIRGAES